MSWKLGHFITWGFPLNLHNIQRTGFSILGSSVKELQYFPNVALAVLYINLMRWLTEPYLNTLATLECVTEQWACGCSCICYAQNYRWQNSKVRRYIVVFSKYSKIAAPQWRMQTRDRHKGGVVCGCRRAGTTARTNVLTHVRMKYRFQMWIVIKLLLWIFICA